MFERNVVLTGFMGTGKTTVGRLLADHLGRDFVDTDLHIVERHGPIDAMFAEHGEGRFRQLERETAEELAEQTRLVIATGGRMMIDAANAEILGSTGHVICLVASLDTILERVDADRAGATRPMLAGDDVRHRVAELMAERAEAYARFDQIDTNGLTPEQIVSKIASRLGSD
jgi:shikimate kinase